MGKSSHSPETKEIVPNKWKDTTAVMTKNAQANKELADAKKNIQKEKKWKIGFGTTDAKDPKNILNVSTTGMKFQNTKKDLEFTIWAASISEQHKPGELPKNSTGLGASLNWKF